MIETYTLQTEPTMPTKVERDGKIYVRREVAARNVREGDLVAFVDMTGASGIGLYSIGEVWHAESVPAGRGRSFVPEWRRRLITVKDWRGGLRSWMVPNGDLTFAHSDRVDVWRVTA